MHLASLEAADQIQCTDGQVKQTKAKPNDAQHTRVEKLQITDFVEKQ